MVAEQSVTSIAPKGVGGRRVPLRSDRSVQLGDLAPPVDEFERAHRTGAYADEAPVVPAPPTIAAAGRRSHHVGGPPGTTTSVASVKPRRV